MTTDSPASLFRPDGRLAEVLPGYEHRPQQEEMAAAVWDALKQGKNLAVEAGTGVGKSLAYLVPAVFWARQTKRRIAVSTYTRLLQTQLINQDIPLVRKLVPDCPEVAASYGQENYLCLFRLNTRVSHGLFDTREEASEADQLLNWADTTKDGVLVTYPYRLPPGLWSRICRDSAACRGRRCPFFAKCFYFRCRATWENCGILIVNHALFFAGLAAEPELLPKAEAVVFDEAHRLEDAAVRHFGAQVSERHLNQLLDSLCPATGRGLVDQMGYPRETRDNIAAEIGACRKELARFFADTAELVPQETIRLRLSGPLAAVPAYALERLSEVLNEIVPDADDEELAMELKVASRRLAEAGSTLLRFVQPDPDNEVQWLENQDTQHLNLFAAPLSVAQALAEQVYHKFTSVVMTSATLTANQSFDFLSHCIGLTGFRFLALDSPFDFRSHALLYVSPELPEPNNAKFIPEAAKLIAEILKASQGRALVLFTSLDTMKQVYELVPEQDYTHLVQGELPLGPLLERFREDTHSVLFATQSFWQGVDIPGESLSCLIICRLPFEVPDEPRLSAVCDKLRAEGIEPFLFYQLPSAILRFRQGFGRLIRTKTDRGVVCVLDRRVMSKNYGKQFINSLPRDIPRTQDLTRVAAFLSRPAETEQTERA